MYLVAPSSGCITAWGVLQNLQLAHLTLEVHIFRTWENAIALRGPDCELINGESPLGARAYKTTGFAARNFPAWELHWWSYWQSKWQSHNFCLQKHFERNTYSYSTQLHEHATTAVMVAVFTSFLLQRKLHGFQSRTQIPRVYCLASQTVSVHQRWSVEAIVVEERKARLRGLTAKVPFWNDISKWG